MPIRRWTPNPEQWRKEHINKSVAMSDRQYSMALQLEAIYRETGRRLIAREVIDTLMGGTVNSFVARGYLKPASATHSYWTQYGSQAIERHGQAQIHRKPSGRFSEWLNLATYDAVPRREDAA